MYMFHRKSVEDPQRDPERMVDKVRFKDPGTWRRGEVLYGWGRGIGYCVTSSPLGLFTDLNLLPDNPTSTNVVDLFVASFQRERSPISHQSPFTAQDETTPRTHGSLRVGLHPHPRGTWGILEDLNDGGDPVPSSVLTGLEIS